MLLALLLGIFFGEFADTLAFLSMPVLALMMTASLSALKFSDVVRAPAFTGDTIKGLLLNYLLHGLLLMLPVYLLIPYNPVLYTGFLLIVFAPPGVVIMPFAALFGGNLRMATAGVLGGYAAFLLLFPLFLFFITPSGIAFPWADVIKILVFIILLPMLLSRPLRHKRIFPLVNRMRSASINWSFFLIIYIVIGLNRSFFMESYTTLLKPSLVIILFLTVFPALLAYILNMKKLQAADVKSFELLFAVKNNGFSAVVSLQLFGPEAAIPSAALSIFLLLYLIVFSFRNKN